jgi:hypothetical protein
VHFHRQVDVAAGSSGCKLARARRSSLLAHPSSAACIVKRSVPEVRTAGLSVRCLQHDLLPNWGYVYDMIIVEKFIRTRLHYCVEDSIRFLCHPPPALLDSETKVVYMNHRAKPKFRDGFAMHRRMELQPYSILQGGGKDV